MKLLFDIRRIPRTTSRKEWEEMWRWKRTIEQELALAEQRQIVYYRTYKDTLTQEQKDSMLNEIVNPPMLLGPHQDMSHK